MWIWHYGKKVRTAVQLPQFLHGHTSSRSQIRTNAPVCHCSRCWGYRSWQSSCPLLEFIPIEREGRKQTDKYVIQCQGVTVVAVIQLLSCVWLFFDPIDYSPPVSFVHGVFQARILEWIAISFTRVSSQNKDQTCVSCIGRWILYHWATGEAHQGVIHAKK